MRNHLTLVFGVPFILLQEYATQVAKEFQQLSSFADL